MHQSDMRRISGHPLRDVLLACCNDPRDVPGRKALRESLVEALPEATPDQIDALFGKAEQLAKASIDPGARFDARQIANQLTLMVVNEFESADRLVPVVEETIDAKAIADAVMEPNEAEKILDSVTSRLVDSETTW